MLSSWCWSRFWWVASSQCNTSKEAEGDVDSGDSFWSQWGHFPGCRLYKTLVQHYWWDSMFGDTV